jgi:hypothetical protein
MKPLGAYESPLVLQIFWVGVMLDGCCSVKQDLNPPRHMQMSQVLDFSSPKGPFIWVQVKTCPFQSSQDFTQMDHIVLSSRQVYHHVI